MAVVLPFERHKNPISNISWEYMNIRHSYHFQRHSTSAQTNRKVGNQCAIDQNMKLSCTRKSKFLQIPLLFYNELGFFVEKFGKRIWCGTLNGEGKMFFMESFSDAVILLIKNIMQMGTYTYVYMNCIEQKELSSNHI